MTAVIDWFLPWPAQALQDVSRRFLAADSNFKIMNDTKTEDALVIFVAKCHSLVNQSCSTYMDQYRRQVHVTPKSYLSFISSYKKTYQAKMKAIEIEKRNVDLGLTKLQEAQTGVDRMKIELKVQQTNLRKAEIQAGEMLKEL
jgi:dynein heavy chain